MSYLNPCHPGLAYGDGVMQGAGLAGQFVKLIGDDLFAVNTDPNVVSAGVLYKDVADGEMPTIYMGGGVYETDNYDGNISAGDCLNVSGNGVLQAVQPSGPPPAVAISVVGGVLKFRLIF